jgi:biotin transport system substrate-specific component
MAAFICVLAPAAIPIGPVPVTLATFAVYIAAAVLGARRGAAAVALYIALGAAGLPVFSNFTGGAYKLVGLTGGYLAGYAPCAAVTGLFADAASRQDRRAPGGVGLCAAGMVIGTILCYTIGTVWFVYSGGGAWDSALATCVLPFLPFDAVKIVMASIISPVIRARIRSIS